MFKPITLGPAQELTRLFHLKYDNTSNSAPTDIDYGEREFRKFLVTEEYKELMRAIDSRDLVEVADQLADLAYVVIGTADTYGIDLDKVFAEVHRSNMTKQPAGGHNAKPLKGPGYEKPKIAELLESMR